MKKFLTIALSLIFILAAFIFIKSKLNEYEIRSHPESLIGKENFNLLFDLCKAEIDVNIYPKHAKELSKYKIHDKDKDLLYKELGNKSDIYLKRTKLFELLGDKVSKTNDKSFQTLFLYKDKDKNAYLYFDHRDNLMMIKKDYNPNPNYLISCSYNKKGNLLEAEISNMNDDVTYFFNSKGQFIYSYTVTHFGTGFSYDYAPYIIK